MKVEIGGGAYPRVGYLQLDIRKGLPVIDIIGDMRLLPFQAASLTEVLTVNTLEHLELCDHSKVFAEFYRVIKPGGRLKICVPDLRWLCRQVINMTESYTTLLSWIYGGYSSPGAVEMFHRSGFCEDYMRQCMDGLFVIESMTTGRNGINVEAVRA